MGKTKTAFVGEDNDKNINKKEKKANGPEQAKRVEPVHLAGLKGGQRVKIVEAAPTEETAILEAPSSAKASKGLRAEKVRSRKYVEAKNKLEIGKSYPKSQAIKLVKELSYSKFDGTMELHLVMKKVGVSAQFTLPFAAGREKKVEVASDDTVTKLQSGKIDFDILVATSEFMPKLVPFARLLGPKGLMPNPKNGTLVTDPKKIKSFSASAITLKTEKESPLIHTVLGKVGQKDEEIAANLETILKAFGGDKQIVRAFIKSTMSPSVRLQLN
jgi:large subunit ribosomal protein L1